MSEMTKIRETNQSTLEIADKWKLIEKDETDEEDI